MTFLLRSLLLYMRTYLKRETTTKPIFRIFYTVGTLMDGARKGNLDKVKKCIAKGIDAEAKTSNGLTALHYASQHGCMEVVQFLMEECHVKEAKTNDGGTALHFASACGHLNIVQYLIESFFVDKEEKDEGARTALHWASYKGNLEIVQYLIETCLVDTEAKDNDGHAAYDLARQYCNKGSVVQYLKNRRATSTTLIINSVESAKDNIVDNQVCKLMSSVLSVSPPMPPSLILLKTFT